MNFERAERFLSVIFTLLSLYQNVLIFQSSKLVIKKDVSSNNLPAVNQEGSARQQLRRHLGAEGATPLLHRAGTPLIFPKALGSG